jgi:hypothetical protein
MEACMQASLFSGELPRVEEKERPRKIAPGGGARRLGYSSSSHSKEA